MKKNNIKIYSKALAKVILEKKDSKKIVDNFLNLLVKNRLEKKAKEIVSLAEDLILEEQGKKKITFLTARKIKADQRKILETIAKQGDVITEKIDPKLVAGVKIIINGSKQFDGSLQKKLQNII